MSKTFTNQEVFGKRLQEMGVKGMKWGQTRQPNLGWVAKNRAAAKQRKATAKDTLVQKAFRNSMKRHGIDNAIIRGRYADSLRTQRKRLSK